MGLRSVVGWTVTIVFLLVATSFVATSVLGYPFLLGYVETGSMEPTIGVGDGYVAVPPALAGDLEEGDVVTFEAQSIDGGGLTTHRIAEETSEGYVTRGDGNAFDDQEAGEPPVQESQVVAVVFQVDGEVLVVPAFGTAAETVQGGVSTALEPLLDLIPTQTTTGTATTGLGVVLILASLIVGLFESSGRTTSRDTTREGVIRSRWLFLAVLVVVALPLATGMLVPSGGETIQVLSSTTPDPDDPTQVDAGGTESIEFTIENNQFVPKVVVLEGTTTGVEFTDRVHAVGHGETATTTLELSAPEETGAYVRGQSEYHYYHVLPAHVIVGLHDVHPLLATGVVTLVSTTPAIVGFLLFVGFRPIQLRSVRD